MARSVYVETTIPSAYVSHRKDPASVYRRGVTRRWWHEQAEAYELLSSDATLLELRSGRFPGQQEAIRLMEPLPRLEITDDTHAVAAMYIRHRVMPASGDALHLAVASLNEIDCLLTWNLRHLANPNKVEHITVINRRLGLLTPYVVTPEALWAEETA